MDKKIFDLINKETKRQSEFVELIASENFVSADVLKATGSILTNKYAEGYPNKRYYGGCEVVDLIEQEAIDRAKKLFKAKFVNVQPHSGSQANVAAYMAMIKPGDKVLGMALSSGGHLTHGYKVNFSGMWYEGHNYAVDPKTERIDYKEVLRIAKQVKPQMIICGASAYPRLIDFKKFREIADEVGAVLMADVAHIAGLIAVGLHQNPLPYCHIVTTTTHKTLRGARGGMIMTNDPEVAAKVDKAIFPGSQGGPLLHVIAGKAVAFGEALKPAYKKYIKDLVDNCKSMADWYVKHNYVVTTGGTDNHLFLLNVKKSFGITGDRAEKLLFHANIVVNKNTVPFDDEKPTITSGIRMGTAAMTTKGFKKKDFIKIAEIIADVLKHNDDKYASKKAEEVKKLLKGIKK